MSQHHISTKRYKILIGWDKPLQYFFGTVWDKAQLDQHYDGVVFTTLNQPHLKNLSGRPVRRARASA
jgi:hypothetical protein